VEDWGVDERALYAAVKGTTIDPACALDPFPNGLGRGQFEWGEVYLAAPLNTSRFRETNARHAAKLRELGIRVFVPNEFGVFSQMMKVRTEVYPNVPEDLLLWLTTRECAAADVEAIRRCRLLLSIRDPEDRDDHQGTLWEIGYARGLGKKVVLCGYEFPEQNLMLVYNCDSAVRVEDDAFDEVARLLEV